MRWRSRSLCWRAGKPVLIRRWVYRTYLRTDATGSLSTCWRRSRPEVDALVLRLLDGLRTECFTEVATGPYAGSCRLMAPFAHLIAEHMGEWGERAARHAAKVAAALTACAASNPIGTRSPACDVNTPTDYRPVAVTLATARRDVKGELPPQTLALVPDELWNQVRPAMGARRARVRHRQAYGRGGPSSVIARAYGA
jgi:hypothetical protein